VISPVLCVAAERYGSLGDSSSVLFDTLPVKSIHGGEAQHGQSVSARMSPDCWCASTVRLGTGPSYPVENAEAECSVRSLLALIATFRVPARHAEDTEVFDE
jgi:hypothetical protein